MSIWSPLLYSELSPHDLFPDGQLGKPSGVHFHCPDAAVITPTRAVGLWPDTRLANITRWWSSLTLTGHKVLASSLKPWSCQVQLCRHWELSALSFLFLGFMLMLMDLYCQTWWVTGFGSQMINNGSNLESLNQAEKRAWGQKRRNNQASIYPAIPTIPMKATVIAKVLRTKWPTCLCPSPRGIFCCWSPEFPIMTL